MATYDIPLNDGTTVTREFDTDEEAVAEQERLNAQFIAQNASEETAGWSTPANILQTIGELPGRRLDVSGELASAFNRETMRALDFLGPGSLNPWNEYFGVPQLPTFEGAYEHTPGAEGGFMEPGLARDVVRGAGSAAPAAAGFFQVAGRNLASPAGALAELMGLGAAKPSPMAAGRLAFTDEGARSVEPAQELVTWSPWDRPLSDEAQEIGRLIDEGSDSVKRFGKQRNYYTGRLLDEPAARESARQGVPQGIVSTVQASNPQTRSRLREMLDIVDHSKESARFSVTNRPLDVAGRSLANRYQVIDDVNRRAGSQLDETAKTLIGEQVDVSDAFRVFNEQLDGMGIRVARDEDGALQVIDEGSDIMGLSGPRNALQRLIERIEGIPNPDAYDLHRIKRYIDEKVSYGKSAEGLSGQVENIVKGLRRNIDAALDAQFPEYNRINTEYSETREVLDEVKRLVGSGSGQESVNFEKGLGTLLRRVLSNARSREPMLDLVADMDQMAKHYSRPETQIVPYRPTTGTLSVDPTDLDDDILTQVLFADELDKVFGTNARTSLLGETTKAAERAAEIGSGVLDPTGRTMWGSVLEGGKWAMDKLRGVNEEEAMKALRELVGD